MFIEILPALLVYAISGGWSPGPNNILLLALAGQYGARPLIPLIGGIWTGLFSIAIAASFTVSAVSVLVPSIAPYAKYVGALYIVYLAYLTLNRQPPNDSANDAREVPLGYKNGFLLQFLNLKFSMLIVAGFSGFIMPLDNYGNFEVLVYAVLMAAGAATGNIIWTTIGNMLMTFCRRHWMLFKLIMGFLLLWCVLKILSI